MLIIPLFRAGCSSPTPAPSTLEGSCALFADARWIAVSFGMREQR